MDRSDQITPDFDPGPREGEYWIGRGKPYAHLMTTRGWAGSLIQEVGECASYGSWPQDVSVFDLGRALKRACGNAPGGREVALAELIRGWETANQPD